MDLSENERRLLRELETRLSAEDPRLANALSGRRVLISHRVHARTNAAVAVAGLIAGVLLIAVGLWRAHLLGIVIALAGYLVVLASTTVAVGCFSARRAARSRAPSAATRARPAP